MDPLLPLAPTTDPLWAGGEVDIEFRRTRRRVTRGWAVLQAVQHTAYHLGQIRLFAKMATTGRDV